MSSTINASTASGGGLVTSADASGILQLQTAGVTALTIDSSQNVGIGTSSPSAPLDIKVGTGKFTVGLQGAANAQLTASGNLRFNTTAGTTVFSQNTIESVRIDSSGNVGIGTSSPAQKLHVVGAVNATTYFHLGGNTSAPASDAAIYRPADGTLAFVANTAERMRIDSSGNVGIGTSSPTNSAGYGTLSLSGATGGQLVFQTSGTYRQTIYSTGTDLNILNSQAGIVTLGTNNTERMRIDSSGTLFLGQTTNPATGSMVVKVPTGSGNGINFQATGAALSYGISFYNNTGGVCGYAAFSGTTTSYVTTSDQRLKENIIDAPSALDSINAIKVRSFDWISDNLHVDYGYIAQELLEVVPEAVSVPEDKDQMMGVDFGKLTPRLVKAIQELKAIIDTQNARIEALEAK